MKNNKISVILTTIILGVLLTFSTSLAQSDGSYSSGGNSNTGNRTSSDTAPNIRQDQTSTNLESQNKNSDKNQNDQAFRSTAQQLASDLVTRLNLSQDKAKDITDILVDYRNNIVDVKKDMANNNNNNSGDNSTGMSGNNGNMVGSGNDAMQKFSKADKDANDKIESTIGKQNVAQYMNIKKDWWKDVKDRVYSSVSSENMGTGSNSDMNNGATGSEKKGSRRGTGTSSGSGDNMGNGSGSGSGSSRDTSGSNNSSY